MSLSDYKTINGIDKIDFKQYTDGNGKVHNFAADNKGGVYYVSEKALKAESIDELMYCECSKDGVTFVPTIYTKSLAAQATTIKSF